MTPVKGSHEVIPEETQVSPSRVSKTPSLSSSKSVLSVIPSPSESGSGKLSLGSVHGGAVIVILALAGEIQPSTLVSVKV